MLEPVLAQCTGFATPGPARRVTATLRKYGDSSICADLDVAAQAVSAAIETSASAAAAESVLANSNGDRVLERLDRGVE